MIPKSIKGKKFSAQIRDQINTIPVLPENMPLLLKLNSQFIAAKKLEKKPSRRKGKAFKKGLMDSPFDGKL